jgi:hypothetical protein
MPPGDEEIRADHMAHQQLHDQILHGLRAQSSGVAREADGRAPRP